MDQTSRDTEGMQGDGVRDDAARAADEHAKAGEPASRTSRDAIDGASDTADDMQRDDGAGSGR